MSALDEFQARQRRAEREGKARVKARADRHVADVLQLHLSARHYERGERA